jgi:hypothetical protein
LARLKFFEWRNTTGTHARGVRPRCVCNTRADGLTHANRGRRTYTHTHTHTRKNGPRSLENLRRLINSARKTRVVRVSRWSPRWTRSRLANVARRGADRRFWTKSARGQRCPGFVRPPHPTPDGAPHSGSPAIFVFTALRHRGYLLRVSRCRDHCARDHSVIGVVYTRLMHTRVHKTNHHVIRSHTLTTRISDGLFKNDLRLVVLFVQDHVLHFASLNSTS